MVGPALAELLWVARRSIAVAASAREPWSSDPSIGTMLVELDRSSQSIPRPAAGPLAAAVTAFGLSDVETAALAVVAAVELDPMIGAIIVRAQGGNEPRPTVGTLVDLLGLDAPTSFLPTSPLITSSLIELCGDAPLVYRPMRSPPAVWTRLAGAGGLQATGAIDVSSLVLSSQLRSDALAAARWLGAARGLLVVWGRAGSGRHALAHAILRMAGMSGAAVDARELATPAGRAELERDSRWIDVVPVVTAHDGPEPGVRSWIEHSRLPRLIIQDVRPDWLTTMPPRARAHILHVPDPDLAARTMMWKRAFARVGWDTPAAPIAERYRFGPGRIDRVVDLSRASVASVDGLRAAISATARPGIALLAEHLPERQRDELILSEQVAREFELAIGWARSHDGWYRDWQMASGTANARGLTCLFAGPPGTGKTMAAQVMAGAIDRDLYRVDLSQAVSKWLGETEKNIGRLFDEAHDAGAVLFFDEADALFARRTTVRDSHDRYANLETGYLLQRLESHTGLVVLATNRRQDLDAAFLRRFDVMIELAHPDADARARLWRQHLPISDRCAPDLDITALARRFELTGGQIRNAVLSAIAYLLVETEGCGAVLALPHLVAGATRELLRSGRLVNPAEYLEWAPMVRAALVGATAATS